MAPSEKNTEMKTEITAPGGADALARAASERADRLEKQNADLKKQLAEAQRAPKSKDGGDVAELRAENEQLKRQRRAIEEEVRETVERRVRGQSGMPRELLEEHRGTKTYRMTQPHYRQGQYFSAGDRITVTDEIPAKNWVLLEAAAPEVKMVDAAPPAQRAADTEV